MIESARAEADGDRASEHRSRYVSTRAVGADDQECPNDERNEERNLVQNTTKERPGQRRQGRRRNRHPATIDAIGFRGRSGSAGPHAHRTMYLQTCAPTLDQAYALHERSGGSPRAGAGVATSPKAPRQRSPFGGIATNGRLGIGQFKALACANAGPVRVRRAYGEDASASVWASASRPWTRLRSLAAHGVEHPFCSGKHGARLAQPQAIPALLFAFGDPASHSCAAHWGARLQP